MAGKRQRSPVQGTEEHETGFPTVQAIKKARVEQELGVAPRKNGTAAPAPAPAPAESKSSITDTASSLSQAEAAPEPEVKESNGHNGTSSESQTNSSMAPAEAKQQHAFPKHSGFEGVQIGNLSTVDFRDLVPKPDHPRIKGISEHNAISWCDTRRAIPEPAWLINRLEKKNLEKPYIGFTNDGTVREDVWKFEEDEGAPVEDMKSAADALIEILSNEEKERTCYGSVEDEDIRLWSNPELYMNPGGLRLDECSAAIQDGVHALLKSSTSKAGYEKIRGCCLTNDFLGHLVNGKGVCNEHSYNFRIFGTPSLTEPWGFTFFGHHLCLCFVIVGKRMVIGPNFAGAEPDWIDEGPHKGLRLFVTEEHLALKLMQSLQSDLQLKATISESMSGEDLPKDRWNAFDERHLGGARQDNRTVPYEGCPVSEFPAELQEVVVTLFKAFNEYCPDSVLEHRVKQFKQYLNETYFAWIGKHTEEDPFYYRIHSPVTFCEFDFHCGIYLTNTSPSRCHIHTIIRLPNRGDYGKTLLAQSSKAE